MSEQLGRRRDPRVRLEQPPFVQGITSAKEEKKYFNARTLPYRPAHQNQKDGGFENNESWRFRVDIAKDEQ